MSKTIKITILHDLAVNAAKNETYQKGVVDKAIDPKLVEAAYHEMAGNEAYHETMLRRFLFTQIEVLKTYFSPYLTGGGNTAEDATISDDNERNGYTDIYLSVSDRFNDGYVKTLARLSQKFVEDRMIHLWWAPVSEAFAKLYAQLAQDDLKGVLDCFQKVAPTAPAYLFPTAITLNYPVIPSDGNIPGVLTPTNEASVVMPEILFQNPWRIAVGQGTEISYTLSGENDKMPVDDIIVRCDNVACCRPGIDDDGRWFIHGVYPGYTIVTLFSRHNDKVFAKFGVRVTN